MPHFNLGNTDEIEIGDFVRVVFPNGDRIIQAEVLYVAVATGDCWRVRDTLDGRLVYIQQFERMILLKKGEQNE